MNPTSPALALHSLLATGHGTQPTLKKQPAPVAAAPGVDPRVSALMALLGQPKDQPAPPPQGPVKLPNKKPIPQHPTDSNAGL